MGSRNITKFSLVLGFLGILSTAPGCAFLTIENGSPINEEVVGLLQVGMDQSEVLQVMGPPEEFRRPELIDILMGESVAPQAVDASAAIFNDVYSYHYTKGKMKIFTIILFTWMYADVNSDDVVVFFNEEGKVKYFSYRKGISG